jgi:hypothetical protein
VQLSGGRWLAICINVCLVTMSLAPALATACEGGGGGSNFKLTASPKKTKRRRLIHVYY